MKQGIDKSKLDEVPDIYLQNQQLNLEIKSMRDEVAQRKRLAQQWQQSLLQLEGKVEQALANTPAVADEQL